MLNTEGESLKMSYLSIDYSTLDKRIESPVKEVSNEKNTCCVFFEARLTIEGITICKA
jgi:hypothetical protein